MTTLTGNDFPPPPRLASPAVALSLLLSSLPALAAALPTPRFEAQFIGKIEKGYGLSVADVDGDGKLDILLADRVDFVWFRHGDWQRFLLASELDGQGAMSIDARDVDGDGQVEIAVCTRGPDSAVYFLRRPEEATQPWTPVKVPSEPEQHRIKWARDHTGRSQLIAVPNLGRRNHLRVKGLPRDDSVRIYAYEFTLDPARHLRRTLLLESMRDMHSLAVVPGRPGEAERLLFVGIEGVELMGGSPTQPWQSTGARLYPGMTAPNRRPDQSLHAGLGEIDLGRTAERAFLATVEPKHGHQVVVYRANAAGEFGEHRQLLDDTLATAHALDCVDLLGIGRDQIVVGWWGTGRDQNFGLRLYVPLDDSATQWKAFPIDEGTLSCQSMQVVDLDGDGRLDIVAAAWSTNNVVIFWNRTAPLGER